MASDHDSDSRVPVLVVCDAGAAGRDLLVRRDLELSWALSVKEASAAMQNTHPHLVLVRESLANEVLLMARKLRNAPPIVVLLEADGWTNRDGYLRAGAAVLVQSSARLLILEAVAELTGRAFPDHLRVPFTEFVEVLDGVSTRLVETVDMSNTGMGLRYLPDAHPGLTVRVQIDTLSPPLSLGAVVIRVDGETVGLRFTENPPDVTARLERLVDAQSARFPPPEMPEGLTVDIGGTLTTELLQSGGPEALGDAGFRTMLEGAVRHGLPVNDEWPRWLVNIERRLTAVERRCFDRDPDFSRASAAIDLRILLARTRLESPYAFPTPDLAQRVLDFSRLLEDHVDGSDPQDLADVTSIRAQLLRAVYGDLSRRGGEHQSSRAA